MNILQIRSEMQRGKTIYDMDLNVGYYARVSTDKDDQLNSLENQSNYFKDMISENKKWNLVGEYIDEGISGTSIKNRDKFLKMIDDSKMGKLDLILTKEISRFSRNVIDSIKYTEELLNNGTVVYFLSDNINTIYPDSEFRLTLMSSLAQDEVRKLSERVKFGIKRMIKEGKVIGGNLTGYYKKDGKLIINNDEREIIEILFNLYSSGKYSFESIAQILYKKGYKNKNGKIYSGTTLTKFLTNPRYKGYYTANLTRVENYKTHKKVKINADEQIVYKTDLIEPIVSEELWNKANELYKRRHALRSRHITSTQKSIDTSKYTGKIICFDDNEIFTRNGGSNRKNNPTWACKKYKKDGVLVCQSPIIREKALDLFIEKILKDYLRNFLFNIKKNMINEYNDVFYEVNNNEKNEYEDKLSELNKNRDKLIGLNLNNIISSDELKIRLEKNDEEKNKINSKIDNLNIKNNYFVRLKNIENSINDICDIKNNLNIYTNLLIDKIIVKKGPTRYKMNLMIYFKDGSKLSEYFEN